MLSCKFALLSSEQFLLRLLIFRWKTEHDFCCEYLALFRLGLFRANQGRRRQKDPLLKTSHTYPTMTKLGTVIPYPKMIQKIYKSRNTPTEFCRHQHFFTGNYSCRRLTQTAKRNWKKFEFREVRFKRFWDLKWKIVEERIM